MRINAVDRHQGMPRHMKINIDRYTQVPSIDVETLDTRHFGSSGLKTQGQAKLRKCPDEFLTQQIIYCLSVLAAEESFLLQFYFEREEKVLERRSLVIGTPCFHFLFIYTMNFYFFIVMNCFAMSEQLTYQIQCSDRFVGLAPNYRSALL